MVKKLNPDYVRRCFIYNPDTGSICRSCGNPTGTKAKSGYIYIGLKSYRIQAHRLAWFLMTGDWPESTVDHINRVKDDNRWSNLRLADRSQQRFNSRSNCNSTSKYKGVHLQKKDNKWRAEARIRGVRKHIGLFLTEEEARDAYNAYVKQAHSEFFYYQ